MGNLRANTKSIVNVDFKMKLKNKILWSLCIVSALTIPVFADMFAPSPICSKPSKPYQFNSQWEIDSFYSDVERYKQCIQNFIEEQNQAVEIHQQAASDAIDEWNRFVNYELN